jgi:hypothetical protein
VYGQAAVYEGQRDMRTIATGEWFGRGRLQEASVFGRTSLARKVDKVGISLLNNSLINVNLRSGHQWRVPKPEVHELFM